MHTKPRIIGVIAMDDVIEELIQATELNLN